MKLSYPLLIIITNSYHTKWFVLEEETPQNLQLLDQVIDNKETYSDHEGAFKTRGTGGMVRSGSGEDLNKEKEHEVHEHLKKMVEHTKELWKDSVYSTALLVAPERIKNSAQEKLHAIIPQEKLQYLPGNFLDPALHEQLLKELHSA